MKLKKWLKIAFALVAWAVIFYPATGNKDEKEDPIKTYFFLFLAIAIYIYIKAEPIVKRVFRRRKEWLKNFFLNDENRESVGVLIYTFSFFSYIWIGFWCIPVSFAAMLAFRIPLSIWIHSRTISRPSRLDGISRYRLRQPSQKRSAARTDYQS